MKKKTTKKKRATKYSHVFLRPESKAALDKAAKLDGRTLDGEVLWLCTERIWSEK